jgi:hypothetical protein
VGRADGGQRAGVGGLVVVDGAREGDEDGGAGDNGQLRYGGGAGTGDHQVGRGEAVGDVREEGGEVGGDAGGGVGLANAGEILGAALLGEVQAGAEGFGERGDRGGDHLAEDPGAERTADDGEVDGAVRRGWALGSSCVDGRVKPGHDG